MAKKEILEKYHFRCKKCKVVHKMALYAAAQLAMGHDMVFTCECGQKTELKA